MVVLTVSVGGGLQIPLMQGDRIVISTSEKKTVFYWFPLNSDGKTIDLSRAKKGLQGERYLHKRFFEMLRLGNHLIELNPSEYIIHAIIPYKNDLSKAKKDIKKPLCIEKRKPLLRLPVRGLPPRWC
jgi:hypothetical protein